MKIGLLLPSALMYDPLSDGKIFAPKELFTALAQGLVQKGHRVRVYAAGEFRTDADIISGEMGLIVSEPSLMKLRYVNEKSRRLLSKNYSRWEYELDLTSRVFKDGREGKVEIIHSFLEFSAHYFAEACGIPTVFTVHDPIPDKKYLDWLRYARFSKDNYVAISNFQAQKLGEIINIAGVVYNGIQPEDLILQDEPGDYLLFVGRYMPEKGIEDAVKAGQATNTQTILAGSKEYKSLPYFQKVIAPYLKNKLIQDIGFMTKKQKSGLYGGAKALLFPIHWDEPFGMVMVEAMACGTPVIAYNRGSVSEIVVDGVTGFVVEEDNKQVAISNKQENRIIKKRGIEGLVEAIGRIGEIDRAACRRHVEENFTVGKMVEGYEKIYKKILNIKYKI